MSTPSSIEVDKNGVLFVTDSGQRSNVRENAKPMSGKNSISLIESKINDRKGLKSRVVKE